MGVGAMLGTGVFVVWTPAWQRAGSLLGISLLAAAVVAALNAWSTARLAAVHPESGGAYAYGRRRLGRPWGVAAGVAFVVGKIASAGAAALAIGAYVAPGWSREVAAAALVVALALDLAGIVRSVRATAVSVAVVLGVLTVIVWRGLVGGGPPSVGPTVPPGSVSGILVATGLIFVAFAGYARVATLGEEVRDPRRTLPRAIALALALVLVVYVGVATVVVPWLAATGALSPAPLAGLAATLGVPASVVTVAAVLAAGGTLLSLIAGVGRTLFAMADAGDAPRVLARVSRGTRVPVRAEVAAAVGVAVVVLVGGIGGALALSAVGVLSYYGVAHLAALRLGADEGRPPRLVPVLGLVGCVVVVAALALAAAGVA